MNKKNPRMYCQCKVEREADELVMLGNWAWYVCVCVQSYSGFTFE